jgi:hypothetical protein
VSTLVSVIKVNKSFLYVWALFCDITLMSLSYVWNSDPGTHMRCMRFSSEKQVWQCVPWLCFSQCGI